MAISAHQLCYSPDHNYICQVIESQTLWGETTCRVWLPAAILWFAYLCLNSLHWKIPEMVLLIVIRVEGGINE